MEKLKPFFKFANEKSKTRDRNTLSNSRMKKLSARVSNIWGLYLYFYKKSSLQILFFLTPS